MKSEFEVYMETGILIYAGASDRLPGREYDHTNLPGYILSRNGKWYGASPGDDRGRTKILCPLHLLNCRESKNTYGADAPNHRQ